MATPYNVQRNRPTQIAGSHLYAASGQLLYSRMPPASLNIMLAYRATATGAPENTESVYFCLARCPMGYLGSTIVGPDCTDIAPSARHACQQAIVGCDMLKV